jgi:hypothetical protein
MCYSPKISSLFDVCECIGGLIADLTLLYMTEMERAGSRSNVCGKRYRKGKESLPVYSILGGGILDLSADIFKGSLKPIRNASFSQSIKLLEEFNSNNNDGCCCLV